MKMWGFLLRRFLTGLGMKCSPGISGSTIINNTNYSQSFEISLTGYWLPNNLSANDGSIIYVREKVHYGNVGEKFVYITYAYKMIDL